MKVFFFLDDVFANQLLQNILRNRAANALRNKVESNYPNSNVSEASCGDFESFPCETQSISQSGPPHIWQYSEVLSLIRSMEVNFENLSHSKKRKHVFGNILNDLLSEGYSLTAEMVQSKWKSLVRSYNSAKDNKNKTGRAPSRFQFFEEMDDLLGNKPSNSCKHSMESSEPGPSNENISTYEDPSAQEETENRKKSIDSPRVTPKRKRTSVEDKREAEKGKKEEAKQQRHMERMQAEKEKIEVEKEKVKLFKEFLELKKRL